MDVGKGSITGGLDHTAVAAQGGVRTVSCHLEVALDLLQYAVVVVNQLRHLPLYLQLHQLLQQFRQFVHNHLQRLLRQGDGRIDLSLQFGNESIISEQLLSVAVVDLVGRGLHHENSNR